MAVRLRVPRDTSVPVSPKVKDRKRLALPASSRGGSLSTSKGMATDKVAGHRARPAVRGVPGAKPTR